MLKLWLHLISSCICDELCQLCCEITVKPHSKYNGGAEPSGIPHHEPLIWVQIRCLCVGVRSHSQPGLWNVPASIVTLSRFYPAFTMFWHPEHRRSHYIKLGRSERESTEIIRDEKPWESIQRLFDVLVFSYGAVYTPAFIYTLQLRINLIHEDYTRSDFCRVWGDSWFSNRTAVQTVYTNNVNVSASCFQNWHHPFMSPYDSVSWCATLSQEADYNLLRIIVRF